MQEIQKKINKIYIFLFFFVLPMKYSNYISIIFIMASMLNMLTLFRHLRLTRKKLIIYMLFSAALCISVMFSPYSTINTILCYIYLIICDYSYKNNGEKSIVRNKEKIDFFYIGCNASILINLLIQISREGIGLNRFCLPTACWDTNICNVILFCFYIYCDRKEYKLWKITAILTIFFSRSSRGTLLMFGLFLSIKFFKKLIKKKANYNEPSTVKVFSILMGSMIITILFSYFWTNVVSSTGVTGYHDSLNDGSNAVRFRANLYAVEAIAENKEFLFYGYDNDIQSLLGDRDKDQFTYYKGYRLVQTHNSILNMFIKNGILFSLLYYILLSRLLKKIFNYNYCEYWIPYLVNAMILHGMFVTDFLLIFMLALGEQEKGMVK